MTSSFVNFPAFSENDLITVGELDGQFIYASDKSELARKAASLGINRLSPLQIELQINDDDTVSLQSPFVPVKDYWLKTAWHHLRDDGLLKTLEYLSEEGEIEEESRLLTTCSNKLLNCLRAFSFWTTTTSSSDNSTTICNVYSSTSLWSSSIIRGVSIHSYLPLIAIAKRDDIIEIKDISSCRKTFKPLKDRNQCSITCLEWAPLSSNLLAVGVIGGVILWNVEQNRFLSCFSEQPVTCISWCPRGDLLACGTPSSSILIIWNVYLLTNTQLKRTQGGGISHINWSPDGGKLLVSHLTLFRVWETIHWTCERWTQLTGRCNTSCWNAEGDILLFAVEGDLSLYYVKFSSPDTAFSISSMTAAVKCADMREYNIGPNEIRVGGHVQRLAWDSFNKRLAIQFTADSGGASHIAIFCTNCIPVFDLIPGGFVQNADEIPVWVGFKGNRGNGSTLVTCWESGEIMFIPLVYSQTVGGRHLEEVKPSFVVNSIH